MKVPTDLEILECIYNNYYHDFEAYKYDHTLRAGKMYVPIDCDFIGEQLNVDGDIVFGRLYYHMNKVYSYQIGERAKVSFFQLSLKRESPPAHDINCIQFPLMASVLADLQKAKRQYNSELFISLGALLISVASILISVFKE